MAANVVQVVIKATNDTGAGFDEAKASADELAGSYDELSLAQDRVSIAAAKASMAQDKLAEAQARLDDLQEGGEASAGQIAAAEDRVAAASLRAMEAQTRLGAASLRAASLQEDGAVAAGAEAEKSGAAAEEGAAGFAKFGEIAAAGEAFVGYEAIKMAMNFQSAMERLVTQAGVPQKELGTLKTGILDLAGAVGFSPESLATSLYHVASNMQSLGATAPQMLNAVKIAAEGAKVGGANLEDVTNALTAAIASGIPGVQNYSEAMGALNAIVGAGDMKMQDLAEAMGSGLMAVVKGYGLSLADVGAALDTFGDNNIRGAHAATDLRMAVQALAVPAAAGKAELASMGLSMQSLADTMRQHGLLAALEELQDHFRAAGITAQEQGEAITNIFGKKAGVGLAVLMDQMDRLKSKYPDIEAGAKDFGTAWGKTQQTLAQQWAEIRASFDSLMTGIGDKLLPVLSAAAGFLARNQDILKALAPVVLALVAAFTLLAGILKVVDIVSDMNPWALAIMAIIAVTVLLVEHWKQVESIAKTVFDAVTGAIETAFDWVKSHWPLLLAILTGPIGLAALYIIDHWNQILAGAEGMVRDVVSWFERLPSMILQAVGNLGHLLFSAGEDVIRGLINGIESMLGALGHAAEDVGHTVASGVGDVLHIFSPSKVAFYHGQMYGQGLINGLESMKGPVYAAAANVGRSVSQGGGSASVSGAGAAGSGTLTLQLSGGGSGLDQMFMTWLKNAVRSGGGDPRIFNKKVVFQ